MSSFLTAEWRNLLMANYEIDPRMLEKYLPCKTELDDFNGIHYISLVGFLFKNTRLKGFSIPWHHTFEEVNLRFYVRYRENDVWKRGVVFIKEIVPKWMISLVANRIYMEKYSTHPMKHIWEKKDDTIIVEYYWKVAEEWNFIKANADVSAKPIKTGSLEEFITEHYWGYTFINSSCTGLYEVTHPKWKVHEVNSFEINVSAELLYGKDFAEVLSDGPDSVLLADGSPITVEKGSRIYA